MILLEGVSYSYPPGDSWAIRDVDLVIDRAEMVLVAGASGTGKSTLLRSMNGLVPHFHGGRFAGTVSVDGSKTATSRPRDLADKVGFVGQDPENHSVAEVVEDDIAFTLENLGMDSTSMKKRVEEVLDALGIAQLRSRSLSTLSGGERQRAAIASTLAAMPHYLVLDEPTSQLDPQSAAEVISSILQLRDEIGVGIALAEHRLDRVLRYADRMAITNGGVDVGSPEDVLARHDIGPPIVQLGRALGWKPLPLGVREVRARLSGDTRPVGEGPGAKRSGPAPGAVVARSSRVEVSLEGVRVLRGVDLVVSEGETVALMGRNGSGKTTLLRTLAGLTRATGRIDRPTSIALVPQNPEILLFRKTVAAELAATLRGRRIDAGKESVAREAELFGITSLLNRYPREMSVGEKTRAAIAAAAAGDPHLVLLDEPTRGMDDSGKRHLAGLFEAWRAMGRAVIIATHDVELAALVATRVVIMGEGEVILDAAPREALAASMTFSTQMNKVFGDPNILTLEDALRAVGDG